MTSQSSDDPDDVTLGEEDQEELRDTLTGHGLAPTAQDPDEDEAYTPTQDEERSWQTFEQNPLRSMYGLADDNNNSSWSLSRRDAVARLPIWGLTCGYFRGPWISSGLKKKTRFYAGSLVSQGPSGT